MMEKKQQLLLVAPVEVPYILNSKAYGINSLKEGVPEEGDKKDVGKEMKLWENWLRSVREEEDCIGDFGSKAGEKGKINS